MVHGEMAEKKRGICFLLLRGRGREVKRGDGKEWGREGGASEISQGGASDSAEQLPYGGWQGPFKKGLSDAPPNISARLMQSLFSSLRKSATLTRASSEQLLERIEEPGFISELTGMKLKAWVDGSKNLNPVTT